MLKARLQFLAFGVQVRTCALNGHGGVLLEFEFRGDAEGDFKTENALQKRGDPDRNASSDLFLRMKGGTKLERVAHSLGEPKKVSFCFELVIERNYISQAIF